MMPSARSMGCYDHKISGISESMTATEAQIRAIAPNLSGLDMDPGSRLKGSSTPSSVDGLKCIRPEDMAVALTGQAIAKWLL